MSDRPVTATRLELEVGAALVTLAAWCWPSDTEARVAAEQAAMLCGVDYIESIALLMDSTACDAHTARRIVADGFVQRVGALVKQGVEPRSGVGTDGTRLDSLGYPPRATEEDTDYV